VPFPAYDAAMGKWVSHWPILVGFDGDTPMQHNASETIGHTARRACRLCAFEGCSVRNLAGTGSAVRWLGYNAPRLQALPAHQEVEAVHRALKLVTALRQLSQDTEPAHLTERLQALVQELHNIVSFLQSALLGSDYIHRSSHATLCSAIPKLHTLNDHPPGPIAFNPEQHAFLRSLEASLKQAMCLAVYTNPQARRPRTCWTTPVLCLASDTRLKWYVAACTCIDHAPVS
jgi:hypothetical protein